MLMQAFHLANFSHDHHLFFWVYTLRSSRSLTFPVLYTYLFALGTLLPIQDDYTALCRNSLNYFVLGKVQVSSDTNILFNVHTCGTTIVVL